jgi:phage gpG-like protein
MSLQIQNSISPALARLIVQVKDRRPVLEAMGTQLVTITKKAFNDASLRAATWPPRKVTGPTEGAKIYKNQYGTFSKRSSRESGGGDGHPLLKKTGALWQSIRITEITATSVTVGSDRKYAAIHQLGGEITPKAAKALRFFSGGRWWTVKKVTMPARPFFPFLGGQMTALAAKKVEDIATAKAKRLIGN